MLDYLIEVMTAAVRGERLPQAPKWNKWVHRILSENHCDECLKLDECWFHADNTPKWPHHPFCHCILENVSYEDVMNEAVAITQYSKFDPYLFNTQKTYPHNKEKLFNAWGYTVADAKWLQKEIEKQGLEKYISGDYSLGKLDENGQRISIRVEIPRKDKSQMATFVTGWMVCNNGTIKLITPYGGT